MLIAHKIASNPTIEQETYFKKASGIARFQLQLGFGRVEKEP